MNTANFAQWKPISEAPVQDGMEYGPCLLGPSQQITGYDLGRWNGAAWIGSDGFPFSPLFFQPLQNVSEILAALGLARQD